MFNDLNQIFALENNTLNPIETNGIANSQGLYTVGSPNLSADRVRTVSYPSVFRVGPFWSTAERTVLFDRFFVKARTEPYQIH